MSNRPIHLFDKAVFEHPPQPHIDECHALRATVILDSAPAALLKRRGWTLVDQWSVYLAPDRKHVVYVNEDGTLRHLSPYHPLT